MRQLTRHTVPVLALAVAACGGDKGPAFTKRFDQLDLAQWEAACGPRNANRQFGSGSEALDEASFASEPASPGPDLPPLVFCGVYYRVGGRITSVSVDVSASTEAEMMAIRARMLDLARGLVPASVAEGLTRLADAPERTRGRVGGFEVQAGFSSTVTGKRNAWRLDVSIP